MGICWGGWGVGRGDPLIVAPHVTLLWASFGGWSITERWALRSASQSTIQPRWAAITWRAIQLLGSLPKLPFLFKIYSTISPSNSYERPQTRLLFTIYSLEAAKKANRPFSKGLRGWGSKMPALHAEEKKKKFSLQLLTIHTSRVLSLWCLPANRLRNLQTEFLASLPTIVQTPPSTPAYIWTV